MVINSEKEIIILSLKTTLLVEQLTPFFININDKSTKVGK